ncbi:hypothetical protein [Niabella hibiscisoli]|uniref:hypothetical protein n=1 Tax=Niabella hibiscisoli TaxID=1825928 RepID=UPI001F0F7A6E|nr:hypothetical protein [Niabella hibiscisoli]MCH5720983.1 hypothetical protein [Niabella hibiscisoli]
MAEKAKQQEREAAGRAAQDGQAGHEATHVVQQSADVYQYDQATTMIRTCKTNIEAATKSGDLEINNSVSAETRSKIGAAIAAMLLPMMPSKKKFYGTLLSYIPLDGITGFCKS